MTDEIADPSAVIADLDRMWVEYPPTNYKGEVRAPLHGSEIDQETVGVNPYWDIVRRMPVDRLRSYEKAVDGYDCGRIVTRYQLTHTFAWAIPSPGDIAWIKTMLDGRGVVEIGAGTGYWAWQLSQAEVDVAAFDEKPFGNYWAGSTQYHPVFEGDTDIAGDHPTRALMLCWPPYDSPMAVDALRAYAGDTLVYMGEHECGRTADDKFFAELESGWDLAGSSPAHLTFDGIHCGLEIYRRKAVTS